jgi:hypothetical protein
MSLRAFSDAELAALERIACLERHIVRLEVRLARERSNFEELLERESRHHRAHHLRLIVRAGVPESPPSGLQAG